MKWLTDIVADAVGMGIILCLSCVAITWIIIEWSTASLIMGGTCVALWIIYILDQKDKI